VGDCVVTDSFEGDTRDYLVLVNDEGQYSLWPVLSAIPRGWRAIGPQGVRTVCLCWIDEHWTDLRPLSLVRQMEERLAGRGETCQANDPDRS